MGKRTSVKRRRQRAQQNCPCQETRHRPWPCPSLLPQLVLSQRQFQQSDKEHPAKRQRFTHQNSSKIQAQFLQLSKKTRNGDSPRPWTPARSRPSRPPGGTWGTAPACRTVPLRLPPPPPPPSGAASEEKQNLVRTSCLSLPRPKFDDLVPALARRRRDAPRRRRTPAPRRPNLRVTAARRWPQPPWPREARAAWAVHRRRTPCARLRARERDLGCFYASPVREGRKRRRWWV